MLARDGGGASRWGQAVLLGRGIAAGMAAVGQWLVPVRPLPAAPSPLPELLPALIRQDLIHLMSEVVLALAQKNQTL